MTHRKVRVTHFLGISENSSCFFIAGEPTNTLPIKQYTSEYTVRDGLLVLFVFSRLPLVTNE